MNKDRYLAELAKLLQFMSSWDRRAALEKYAALFDASEDPEALLEELGTPTRLAISLAQTYVPTPPPETASQPVPAVEPAAEAPTEEEPELTAPKRGKARRIPGFLAMCLPTLIVVLGIALPLLGAGAGIITAAAKLLIAWFSPLRLMSDRTLLVGGVAAVCGLGMILIGLGVWLAAATCTHLFRTAFGTAADAPALAKLLRFFTLTGGLLLAVGLVAAGVGWLTGASPTRMAVELFGSEAAARVALADYLALAKSRLHTLLGYII